MSTPSRFRAETKYGKSQERKANRNLPTMAAVGNGDGATVATGRANFYWIRLVDDDNRLTQCYSLVPLSYDDLIYVRRARDRDLSYYEFDKFIQDSGGGTAPPVQAHDLLGPGHGDTATDAPTQGSLVVGSAVPDWDELVVGLAHQILKVNAGATDPVWAAFDWDDISAAAAADMVHNHSAAGEGGDGLNPETLSSRCYVVGPSCPNTTLGQAITDVNAAGPPASGTEYVIFVLGRTTEAGAITIPAYCHVVGMGEGTIINMGANVLTMSSNSSLLNLVVLTTMTAATVNCIRHQSISDFVLRNVRLEFTPHSSGANVGFYFLGTASGSAYHCVADPQGGSATGTVTGFAAEDEATILLWDCEADDTTNLDDALWIGDVVDTPEVTTKYCTFRADGNDVNLVATMGAWYDLASHYDAGNITVNGTYTPLPQSMVNLDGRADALILDADGDTTISAPTDDQIDVEIGGTDYGELIPNVLGWDEVVDVGTWYDHKFEDATDGSHFRDNDASYPAGWTESDAAATTDTNTRYSFWYLRGTNAEVSWKYRRQMNATITAGTWCSFLWGPILWRDGDFTADVDYYFGLYSDDGLGAIDEDIYIRVHLWWDSANSLWKIRGEEGDGSAGNEFTNPDHTGAWQTFTFPIHQPIWVRNVVRNVAAQTCRAYVGTAPWHRTHTLLLDQNPTAANWDVNNGLWLQTHQTRGAGAEDYLFIGAVDYQTAV